MKGRWDVAEPAEKLSEEFGVFSVGRAVLGDDVQLHGRVVLKVDDEGAYVVLLDLALLHQEPDRCDSLHKLDMVPENVGAVLQGEAERRRGGARRLSELQHDRNVLSRDDLELDVLDLLDHNPLVVSIGVGFLVFFGLLVALETSQSHRGDCGALREDGEDRFEGHGGRGRRRDEEEKEVKFGTELSGKVGWVLEVLGRGQ